MFNPLKILMGMLTPYYSQSLSPVVVESKPAKPKVAAAHAEEPGKDDYYGKRAIKALEGRRYVSMRS